MSDLTALLFNPPVCLNDIILEGMPDLEFVLHGATVPAEELSVRQVCHALTHDLQRNQLFVQSEVPRCSPVVCFSDRWGGG
jgi:hypothetical protein